MSNKMRKKNRTVTQKELTLFLDNYLDSNSYEDYAPNGLQVQGTSQIDKIGFAVSASLEAILNCQKEKASALIVHHGLFWKNELRTLTGNFHLRIKALIDNDINLLAYHLPLDGHQEIGHAAILAKKLSLSQISGFGPYRGKTIGVKGVFKKPVGINELNKQVEEILGRVPLSTHHLSYGTEKIKKMAIITGAASAYWKEAYQEGLDCYLTGELREQDWHEARECQFHLIGGGHNKTEEMGVRALMELIGEKFGVETFFIPSSNPV